MSSSLNGLYTVKIVVVQEPLYRVWGFVQYRMAICLDVKPSMQAASTHLGCEVIIRAVFTLPKPLLGVDHSILFHALHYKL